MRGANMTTKIRRQVMNDTELSKFIENDCKLLTSKQLAAILGVSEGALRKQRSKSRSIFKYAKIGKRVFYPTDLVVQTIHEHLVGA